jgi:hypothetical protein
MANAPTPNDLTRQQLDELDALLQKMLALPLNKPDEPPAPPRPAADVPTGWRADRPATAAPPLPHLADPPEPADAAETVAAFGLRRPEPAAPPARPPQVLLEPPVSYTPAVPPTPATAYAPPPPPEPVAPAARLFGPPTAGTGVPPSAGPAAPPPAESLGFDSIPMPSAARSLPDFGSLDLAELRDRVENAKPAEPPPAAPPRPSVPVAVWPLFVVNWLIETALCLFGPPGRLLTTGGMKHVLGTLGLLMLAAAGLWTARGFGWVQFDLDVKLR